MAPMHRSNPRHAITHITTMHKKEAHKERHVMARKQDDSVK